MDSPVSYILDNSVATIVLDDGKVNVLSVPMQTAINAALDQAAADGAVVVLMGREGRFSAGFDLATLNAGGPDALTMLRGGFELAERLLSFPTPVVIACTGHTIAMASFLLLSGDYRVGAAGPFKITANEVAIGMRLPWAAIELCRHRLTPAAFNRATILAEVFTPDDAVAAGFLDRVVPAAELRDAAQQIALGLAQLDMTAHTGTKLRVREAALTALRSAIDAEFGASR
jgi:enoyl-CoA hydratase